MNRQSRTNDHTAAANGLHLADTLERDKPEPDTKGKPGAGAGPIPDHPETPPPTKEPDVDAGSQ